MDYAPVGGAMRKSSVNHFLAGTLPLVLSSGVGSIDLLLYRSHNPGEGYHMTPTKIGLLFASALALTVTAPEANATSLNLALKDSTRGLGLVQKAHSYNRTSCHAACAGSPAHNNRWFTDPWGRRFCVTYTPCASFLMQKKLWRPHRWWRRD